MDTVFSLVSEADRTSYLHSLMQAFNCNYICLWLYLPQPTQSNLHFLDGYYHENNNHSRSSSGSLAQRLFAEYRREVIVILNDRVPGMAFLNNQSYRELTESELRRMASVAVQRQFYQEARIKTAVFMGCRSGEIEMGWSNTQINMENTVRKLFSEEIPHQQSPLRELTQPVDKNRPSSSSSSLRSLSMGSPESSPFLFNIPTTTSSCMPEVVVVPPELTPLPLQPMPSTSTAMIQQQVILKCLQQIQSTTTSSPLQYNSLQSLQPILTTSHPQATRDFALSRNVQLSSQESDDAATTRAILAVLTSPCSSTPPNNLPYHYPVRQRATCFKNYLPPTTTQKRSTVSCNRQSFLKRAIIYYKSLKIVRREHMQASRPTTTQMHHIISERKRREKINESFEVLRELLPPGAKKDKASVLNRTREYLTSLKAQVAELSQRNQQLEAQVQVAGKVDTVEAQAQVSAKVDTVEEVGDSSNERVEVRVTHVVSESTSEEQRMIDLQVVVRREGNDNNTSDVVIRILEFLNQVRNINLMSIEATTRTTADSRSYNRVILGLRIEGIQWDESTFQEAVRRVVADLAQ